MRLPAFTAEVSLRPQLTDFGHTLPAGSPCADTVEPATTFTECLRLCRQSGADGCSALCRCVASGGMNCPVTF